MDKLTKEQIAIFTGVAVVLMLVAFFFVKFMRGYAPVELIGEVGWFGAITLVLALLAPIYTLLYALRDLKVLEPVMEPIKPIFTNFITINHPIIILVHTKHATIK